MKRIVITLLVILSFNYTPLFAEKQTITAQDFDVYRKALKSCAKRDYGKFVRGLVLFDEGRAKGFMDEFSYYFATICPIEVKAMTEINRKYGDGKKALLMISGFLSSMVEAREYFSEKMQKYEIIYKIVAEKLGYTLEYKTQGGQNGNE